MGVATNEEAGVTRELDALVVGAGFSGLYQLDRLRTLGYDVELWEAGERLGGIWFWNCYPGARVDSEGAIYQYSRPDLWEGWDYSERFPDVREIRSYFAYVDERLGLSRDIRFGARVARAAFDDAGDRWVVRSADGLAVRARFLIMATGVLARPYVPPIPGIAEQAFTGAIHHTSSWPQEGVDLAGRRVAVIGTGASGVQVVQEAAHRAAEVTVFQRTPAVAMPMRQKQLTPEEQRTLKAGLPTRLAGCARAFAGFDFDFRAENARDLDPVRRDAVYRQLWDAGGLRFWLATFQDVLFDEEANASAYDFWRDRVRERIDDPAVAEKLAPTAPPHPFGVKRVPLEQDYYDAFNQDNVHLVDLLEEPIAEITAPGVRTTQRTHDADVIVLATGFDAVTGSLTAIDISGPGGVRLGDKWSDGVRTHLGVATAGFPNLLMVDGPQNPSGLCNGPTWAEVQGELIVQTLEHLRAAGHTRIEPTEDAERAWERRITELFEATLFDRGHTWYVGANIPGKRRQMLLYPGGLPSYRADWADAVARGYAGFRLA